MSSSIIRSRVALVESHKQKYRGQDSERQAYVLQVGQTVGGPVEVRQQSEEDRDRLAKLRADKASRGRTKSPFKRT